MFSRSDGLILYGKLGFDSFSTSGLLYPQIKIRLRLIKARSIFNMISDNHMFSLRIVDCLLHNRRIALKDDYQKNRMDMFAFNPVKYNYFEALEKAFIIRARKIQLIQENIFNKDLVLKTALAMNTNAAFTGSYTKNPFWYHYFTNRQNRTLRGGQPIAAFVGAVICCPYMLRQWKQWTLKLISCQFLLIILNTTMCWGLLWLQRKMQLKFIITQNTLAIHWDWG